LARQAQRWKVFRAKADPHRERLPIPDKVAAARTTRRVERSSRRDGAVRNAQSPAARQAAALAFQKSFPPGGCSGDGNRPGADGWITPNVVDFFPVARPGIEAPLGWTLSKYSQESLEQQLGNPDNLCSAAVVRAWFTGETGKPAACY
jgi:hypothetical protein